MESLGFYDTLNRFIGYGDLHRARVFFVGLEEGGDAWSKSDPEFYHRMELREKHQYLERALWDQDNPKWRDSYNNPMNREQTYLAIQLRKGMLGSNKGQTDCREYFCEEFGNEFEFQTNVYPLACHNQEDWPPEYPQLFFGTSPITKGEYYENCFLSGHRPELLKNITERVISSPELKLMVVMARGAWEVLENKVFKDPNISCPNKHKDWKINGPRGQLPSLVKWSNDKRIWMCGHPSNGWFTKEVADFIAATVRGS